MLIIGIEKMDINQGDKSLVSTYNLLFCTFRNMVIIVFDQSQHHTSID